MNQSEGSRRRPRRRATMDYAGCDEPSLGLMVAWAVLFILLGIVLYGLVMEVALRVVECLP